MCMTSNVSSENCHYFDVYMEHEEHVYCRKDCSVQQGVVREGDVPPPARSAKLKVICVKTQFQTAFVVIIENFLSTCSKYSTTCTLYHVSIRGEH